MIATVEVCFHAAVTTIHFLNEEQAEAAYNAIMSAVNGYEKYKNDKTETVEVDTPEGKASFKLENIQGVLFNKGNNFETMLRERLTAEKLARQVREELGLPQIER